MASENGINRVVRDIADLGELQMQLLSIDGRVASEKAVRAAVFGIIGVAILGSALTTLLISCGWMLYEGLEWPIGLSLLAVAVIATVIAAGFALAAYLAAKRAVSAMNETAHEFSENLKWIKRVLVKPDAARDPLCADGLGGEKPRNYARADSAVGSQI